MNLTREELSEAATSYDEMRDLAKDLLSELIIIGTENKELLERARAIFSDIPSQD